MVVVTLFIGVVVAQGFIRNPPTPVKPHTHEGEGQQAPTVLEATLDDIDRKSAKVYAYSVPGMNSEKVAQEVTEALHSSCEGLIGKVTADLEKGLLTLEHDAKQLSGKRVVQVISELGYPAKPASSK